MNPENLRFHLRHALLPIDIILMHVAHLMLLLDEHFFLTKNNNILLSNVISSNGSVKNEMPI